MENSRMLGEFLVKNGVISPRQLHFALEEQKKAAHNFSLISQLEKMFKPRDIDRIIQHKINNDCTIEESILTLKLLSKKELDNLIIEMKREFRIPLGRILVDIGFIAETDFDAWIRRFENQDFKDTDAIIELLKKVPLFKTLDDGKLLPLIDKMTYKYFPAGESIYMEGFDGTTLYLVETGLVRLSIRSGNDDVELGSMKTGDFFGLDEVLTGSPYSERAMAVMNTTVWRISRKDVLALLRENPDIAIIASELLSSELQKLEGTLKEGKKSVNTSNIVTVMIDREIPILGEIIRLLAEHLRMESPGETLLIHSVPVPGFPASPVNDLAATGTLSFMPLRSRHGKNKHELVLLHLAGLDGPDAIEKISRWLAEQSFKFSSIIFLTATGSEELLTFLLNISGRMALILKDRIPESILSFKPGQNRIYLLQSNSLEQDNKTYQKLVSRLKGNEMVAAPHLLKAGIMEKNLKQIARWLQGKSVGVAFGGGGARTIPQMSMLKVLEREGFIIDAVSGCSFGALTASMKALGMEGTQIINFFDKELLRRGKSPFSDWAIPMCTGSISRGKKYRKLVRRAVRNRYCLETEIANFPIAVSMENGAEIIVRHAPIQTAVLASGAAPGFLPLVKCQGVYMGDGGMVDNVPALPLKEYGCDFVISCNAGDNPGKVGLNPRNFASNLWICFDIVMNQSTKKYLSYTDFELRPPIAGFSAVDFTKGRELLQLGERYIEEKMDELKRQAAKAGISIKNNGHG